MNEVLEALPFFSGGERKKLLDGLCRYPELLEDLSDLLTILERNNEATRPYEEFAEELRSEGRL